MGYAALAEYNGIILPISINLTSHEDSFGKEYFSSSSYEPADLDLYIKNTVLTYPVKNIQATLFQYRQKSVEENMQLGEPLTADLRTATIPIDNAKVIPDEMTLTSRFGLQCLGNRHLTNFFCNVLW